MGFDDVPRVLAIADSLDEAPHWTRDMYLNALDPAVRPTRIALVAEDPEADVIGFLITVMVPPQAELETLAVSKLAQRQGIGRPAFRRIVSNSAKNGRLPRSCWKFGNRTVPPGRFTVRLGLSKPGDAAAITLTRKRMRFCCNEPVG